MNDGLKTYLTKDIVENHLVRHFAGSNAVLWSCGIAFVLFAIIGIWYTVCFVPAALFLCAFIATFSMTYGWRTRNNYYIIVDGCVDVVIDELDDSSYYYLVFKNYGKHRLLYPLGYDMSSISFCETTSIGDVFYLVIIKKHRKPCFVYPAKKYEIEKNSFIEKDNQFFPYTQQ